MRRKRIQFTRHELDLINRMAAIASATGWGEGDYQDWQPRDERAYASLRRKVWALQKRWYARRGHSEQSA
jgi:hypothetical protein